MKLSIYEVLMLGIKKWEMNRIDSHKLITRNFNHLYGCTYLYKYVYIM